VITGGDAFARREDGKKDDDDIEEGVTDVLAGAARAVGKGGRKLAKAVTSPEAGKWRRKAGTGGPRESRKQETITLDEARDLARRIFERLSKETK